MPVVMLIAGPETAGPVVGPEAAGTFGRLGITGISVLTDRSGIGVVLEGWAFNPAAVDEAVRAMFPGGVAGLRVLREIERVAVAVGAGEERT